MRNETLQKVYRQKIAGGDKVSIAIFELKYVASPPKVAATGKIEVMNGAHTGKRLALNKPLTTIGKPGSAVVAITYAGGTYSAAKIDGEIGPSIHGAALEEAPRRLAHGDVLDSRHAHDVSCQIRLRHAEKRQFGAYLTQFVIGPRKNWRHCYSIVTKNVDFGRKKAGTAIAELNVRTIQSS
jgi:hypothetical protein